MACWREEEEGRERRGEGGGEEGCERFCEEHGLWFVLCVFDEEVPRWWDLGDGES